MKSFLSLAQLLLLASGAFAVALPQRPGSGGPPSNNGRPPSPPAPGPPVPQHVTTTAASQGRPSSGPPSGPPSGAAFSLSPIQSGSVFSPNAIPSVSWGPNNVIDGKNALSQSAQNGQSWLGVIGAPQYGAALSGSSWGGKTCANTNPYTSPPNTGVVRSYNFVVSRMTLAPDGYAKTMIVVNGQFPGPAIEANWGDTIQVTVTNQLTDEGTAIHMHGLLQQGTPYADGVPGVHQCPIPPGGSYTYTFAADLYGTSWYHAHYSAQYSAGLVGPVIIHGPTNANYDIDLGPVMLSDHYHKSYEQIVAEVMGTDLRLVMPQAANNLINGKNDVLCGTGDLAGVPADNVTCTLNAGLSHFQFTYGKTHRLRLINSGANGIQKFSIDSHQLTVMAYDFVPIVPYTTNVVTLGVGQRADVLVTANGSPTGAYWMRSLDTCSMSAQPLALGIVYYNFANSTAKPNSTAWTDTSDACSNDPLAQTVPYYSITPPSTPATTMEADVGMYINATGHFLWTLAGGTFRADYNDPLLFDAVQGTLKPPYPLDSNVFNFGTNTSIRLVVQNHSPVSHPMHIHGHNIYVLASGYGQWSGQVTNPSNPTRRDVQLLNPGGYIVLQIDATNTGVWPFHCHIAWHASSGLYMTMMERTDLYSTIPVPAAATQNCAAWSSWTSRNIVDEIDSGV